MHRTIKFRGFNVSSQTWYYGEYYTVAGNHFIKNSDNCCFRVDPASIGQFTGLGVGHQEIYEGDIVKFKEGGESNVAPVVWNEGGYVLYYSDTEEEWLICELPALERVVGNIYQHAGLLGD